MNLKDCFRYKHKLSQWMDELCSMTRREPAMYDMVETHMKSQVLPKEKDVEVQVPRERIYGMNCEQILKLVGILLEEYNDVSRAIDQTMSSRLPNYKSVLDGVSKTREIMDVAKLLLSCRPREEKRYETASYVNDDGVASTYTYQMITSYKPTFDVNRLSKSVRSALDNADDTSNKLEQALINTDVEEFVPKFSVNDTIPNIASMADVI